MSTQPADLVVRLERPLEATLPAGKGTALFLLGTCFHPDEAVLDLELLLDGVPHRPTAFSMPRPDVLAQHPEAPSSYRSGFWATVPVPAREHPGSIAVALVARLASGARATVPLGKVEVVEQRSPPIVDARPEDSGPGLIAICMATFEPAPALFQAQVESLRAQTDDRWICLISDDCSGPEHVARIREIVGDDPRFAFSHADARLGFYRNFERAIGMVPREAQLVALCDQDDRWHPDKLAALRAALALAPVAYSDQRLVDGQGRLLRDTFWEGRRNNHTWT